MLLSVRSQLNKATSNGLCIIAMLLATLFAPYTMTASQIQSARTSALPQHKSYVLNFPADGSVGTLKIRYSNKKVERLPAKGQIKVPIDAYVSLEVNFDTAKDLSPLRSLPPNGLSRLALNKLEIKDEQLKDIQHLTGLSSLNLQETDISDKGLMYLSSLRNLTDLNLRSTLITGDGLAKLEPLANLHKLNISSNRLNDSGLISLRSLKKLTYLSMVRSGITDRGLKAIAPIKQLRTVQFSYCSGITDNGIANLMGMQQLSYITIARTSATSKCAVFLKEMKGLKEVIYERWQLGDSELRILKHALPGCRFIEFKPEKRIDMELFEPLH